ncbi:GNAT family N-acetyltransferase [Paenibacillus oryzisoli]|uniref:GNAT family N-acetyltransferase n=1 Tax=Paenibacillus oryzisoli TaxID=1850517 RepID=UPI003D2AA669
MEIRKITKQDAAPFWQLRLEGLQQSPISFSSSHEEAMLLSHEQVLKRINEADDNYILGCFDEAGELVGMAGFMRETSLKLKHKGFIWGVYVTQNARKQGIGRRLMEEIIRQAKELPELMQICLSVTSSNLPAKRMYETLGFVTYGVEKNALFVDGVLWDEDLMALQLV